MYVNHTLLLLRFWQSTTKLTRNTLHIFAIILVQCASRMLNWNASCMEILPLADRMYRFHAYNRPVKHSRNYSTSAQQHIAQLYAEWRRRSLTKLCRPSIVRLPAATFEASSAINPRTSSFSTLNGRLLTLFNALWALVLLAFQQDNTAQICKDNEVLLTCVWQYSN